MSTKCVPLWVKRSCFPITIITHNYFSLYHSLLSCPAGSSVTTTSKAEEQPPSPVVTTPSTPRRPPPSIPVDKKPPKKEEPAAQTIATKQPSSDPEPAVEERPEPTHNTPVMPTSSKECEYCMIMARNRIYLYVEWKNLAVILICGLLDDRQN